MTSAETSRNGYNSSLPGLCRRHVLVGVPISAPPGMGPRSGGSPLTPCHVSTYTVALMQQSEPGSCCISATWRSGDRWRGVSSMRHTHDNTIPGALLRVA